MPGPWELSRIVCGNRPLSLEKNMKQSGDRSVLSQREAGLQLIQGRERAEQVN